jgi:hypothetical protein
VPVEQGQVYTALPCLKTLFSTSLTAKFNMHHHVRYLSADNSSADADAKPWYVVQNKHNVLRGLHNDKRGPQGGTAPRSKGIFVFLA